VITTYAEPNDKAVPARRWKLIVFKEGKEITLITLITLMILRCTLIRAKK
jgi:hypothetical protein